MTVPKPDRRNGNLPDTQCPESHEPSDKKRQDAWWKIHLFRGMTNDLRRRIPYYPSDWLDAWNYRVIPATVYMYFAKYAIFSHSHFSSKEMPQLQR